MCLGPLCPGTTGPSMEVVRNILLPQTIGDECPLPGIGVFHWTFLELLQWVGNPFSSDIPWLPGPLNCGQLEPAVGLDPASADEQAISADASENEISLLIIRCIG